LGEVAEEMGHRLCRKRERSEGRAGRLVILCGMFSREEEVGGDLQEQRATLKLRKVIYVKKKERAEEFIQGDHQKAERDSSKVPSQMTKVKMGRIKYLAKVDGMQEKIQKGSDNTGMPLHVRVRKEKCEKWRKLGLTLWKGASRSNSNLTLPCRKKRYDVRNHDSAK